MSRKCIGIASTTAALLVFAGIVGLPRHPLAAPPEDTPTIDDLVGSWQMRIKQTEVLPATGGVSKDSLSDTWEAIKLKTGAIAFGSPALGISFYAHYRNGLLLGSFSFAGEPAIAGYCFVAQVTGKPGKLKIRGTYAWYSLEVEGGAEATFSGKFVGP